MKYCYDNLDSELRITVLIGYAKSRIVWVQWLLLTVVICQNLMVVLLNWQVVKVLLNNNYVSIFFGNSWRQEVIGSSGGDICQNLIIIYVLRKTMLLTVLILLWDRWELHKKLLQKYRTKLNKLMQISKVISLIYWNKLFINLKS